LPSDGGSSVIVEAKIDSLADAEQLRDAALAHPDALLVLLVPHATATDVQEATRDIDAVVVEWGRLLAALDLPLAEVIAKDVAEIHHAPSSKGSQREALDVVLGASTWPTDWTVWLQAGKTGWPSLVVESPSGSVLGQLEGPRDTMAPMTFRPVIGLTEQDEKKLSRILIRCVSSFEDADDLEISYRRGDTTGRAERLGVPDWLARGYGESYVGVRLKHESNGVAAFRRLVAAGRILEAHATSPEVG
jgi:hypothetical protein